VHVLVVPKEHVSSLKEVGKLPDSVAMRIFEVAQEVAVKMDIAESDTRLGSTTDVTRIRRFVIYMPTLWAAERWGCHELTG
jgi:hypothetical protein